MSRKQSISQKRRYKTRTKKQEAERVKKILRTKRLRMRDPEYAEAVHRRRVLGTKKQWKKRTRKDRKAISRKISKTVREVHAAPNSVYKSEKTIGRQRAAGKRNYASGKNRKGLELGRLWEKNIRRRKKNISLALTGNVLSTKTRNKISKSVKALYNDAASVYNSKVYKEKQSDAQVRRRKHETKERRRVINLNISRSLRLFYRNLSDKDYEEWLNKVRDGTQKAKNRRPNKTEAEIARLIKKFGFVYVGDKMFWIGRANPDFVNRGKKLVVELFGRYFHTNEEHDKARIRKIRRAGWKVLVIWDDLFRKNPDRQIKRVERFVARYN